MKPTILFIHGFGEDAQIWDDFLPNFSWDWDIEKIDYSAWTDCSSIAEYADKIVKELNQGPYYLVGHSMGGYIALELASKYSDKILKVAMVNSTAKADTEEKKVQRAKTAELLRKHGTSVFIRTFLPNMFAESKREELKGLIDILINKYQELSNEALAMATESMSVRADFQSFLQETSIPFLFIAGEEDSFFTIDSILEYLQFPGSKHSLVSLPIVGHHATYEAPTAVHYLLEEFFNQ